MQAKLEDTIPEDLVFHKEHVIDLVVSTFVKGYAFAIKEGNEKCLN